jgi:hypothetical protein
MLLCPQKPSLFAQIIQQRSLNGSACLNAPAEQTSVYSCSWKSNINSVLPQFIMAEKLTWLCYKILSMATDIDNCFKQSLSHMLDNALEEIFCFSMITLSPRLSITACIRLGILSTSLLMLCWPILRHSSCSAVASSSRFDGWTSRLQNTMLGNFKAFRKNIGVVDCCICLHIFTS